jgi:hypothetical protein
MTRLLMSLVLIAACSGSGKKPPTTGSGSGPVVLAKKIILSWGISPKGELADIFLATTDETGKQVSHSVGAYKGTCAAFKPAKEMNAITGVQCLAGGGGTELHAVVQGGEEIVVLQMGINPGETPDPMSRVEVTRVKIPLGIAVEAAP